MIFSVVAQFLDAAIGFPTGFDVVADHVEQYMEARKFILSLKLVGWYESVIRNLHPS